MLDGTKLLQRSLLKAQFDLETSWHIVEFCRSVVPQRLGEGKRYCMFFRHLSLGRFLPLFRLAEIALTNTTMRLPR